MKLAAWTGGAYRAATALTRRPPNREGKRMDIFDLVTLERHRARCSWVAGYGFVTALASSISARNLCEIGVAYGYHAEQILDSLPGVHYQGVDPYRAGYDPGDPFVADVAALFAAPPQAALDRLHAAVCMKLVRYDGRATVLRMPAPAAAARFADGFFDLVYIDGDHTRAAVEADLAAWYPKVRPGGILCGDDFDWGDVAAAVIDFMGKRGKALTGYRSAAAGRPEKWSVRV
jgi:predicted O-methyltransferase YrrM